MTDLANTQRAFQNYLTTGDEGTITGLVRDAPTESASVRLGIYQEAYKLRLIEALSADFGTLHACLGDEGFSYLGNTYADAQPSDHPSIRWFGRHLVEFVRTQAPWADNSLIGDVAALDWAISLSFDAADAPRLVEADMMAIAPDAWPTLRFGVHPSVNTVDLQWNVGALRLAADAGEDPEEPECNEDPVRWLVWRDDYESRFRSMTVDEAFSLASVVDGATFADICEGLTEWVDPEHAAMHAAGTLRRWIVDGVLSETL
jgi:hypothetical protein